MPIVAEWSDNTTQTVRNLQLIPRLKWKHHELNTYQNKLDNNLSLLNDTFDTAELLSNQLIACIQNSIINTNHISSGKKKYKNEWFDKECMKARKKSFSLLNAVRNSNCQNLRKWYIEENTRYKNLCLKKKTEYENQLAYTLGQTKDSKQFWKVTKKINGSNFTIGIGVTAEDLSVHFKNILCVKSDVKFSYAEPYLSDEILESEITFTEIYAVILKAKNEKAPGEDGVPYEFFKNGTEGLIHRLKSLFNVVLQKQDVPASFKNAVIFPIHKKGDTNNVENYRGISFMNVIAKLFCGVLANRLEKWTEAYDIITKFQAGFRKSFSTVDHIFTLTSIVKALQARNKKIYAFFVDFKSAFDLVNRNALFYKLSMLGMSTKFIHAIKEMYAHSKASVWDGSTLSNWFETDTGVKQGCLLSALLFALYINDIETCLPGGVRIADLVINVLLYADDLVILSETPENLQLMINRLSDYCTKWGLTINTNKSKVMVFSRYTRSQSGHIWTFNGNILEVVSKYKYLGVNLNKTMDFNEHVTSKSASSQSLLNMSWKNIFSNQRIVLSAKYKIFDAVIKSSLCYAAQVWGTNEFEAIEKFQRSFLKKLFNLPIKTPNYALYLETGLAKIFTYTLKLNADYIVGTLAHHDNRLTKQMALYELRNSDWWVARWKNLGNSCGETVELDHSNLLHFKEKLYKIIQAQEDFVRNAYIQEARKSESRFLYSQLKLNLMEANYFNDALTYKEISLIFKTRCEVLGLNGTPYNNSFNQFCSLCNLKAKENCFHLISVCPIFAQHRIAYFGQKMFTLQETITLLNYCVWKKLYLFLKDILKYRMLLITEYE